MIRLFLHGSTGKMGKVLQELVKGEFAGEFQFINSVHRGSSTEDREKCREADGIIDFTSADGLNALLDVLGGALYSVQPEKMPFLLTGSTGFGPDVRAKLHAIAGQLKVLWAANYSPGVFLLRKALSSLRDHPLLDQFEIKMRDLHHSKKKDAPSGTALILKESLGREIPIESIREGEIIGRHEVQLRSPFETVELIHEAGDRRLFARGALLAARELARSDIHLPRRLLSLDDLYS